MNGPWICWKPHTSSTSPRKSCGARRNMAASGRPNRVNAGSIWKAILLNTCVRSILFLGKRCQVAVHRRR
jgi:hypothetical protein